LFLTVETETLYVIGGKSKYEVYTARGVLKDSNTKCALECITMEKCNSHVLLRNNAIKKQIVTDNTKKETKLMAYYSKKTAKESMMWYIATVICSPVWWLKWSIPPISWRNVKEISINNAGEEVFTRYAVLTLQNGPEHCCKGDSFCTLVLNCNTVYARIESTNCEKECFFLMAENVEIEKVITTHYGVDSQKFNQKEVTDQSASDDFGITPSMDDNQMIEEHVEVVLPTMGDHRMIGEHAEVVHEGMVRGTDRSAKRLKPNNDDGYRKYREFVEVAEELPCKRKNA
jgi:hypothetical protein